MTPFPVLSNPVPGSLAASTGAAPVVPIIPRGHEQGLGEQGESAANPHAIELRFTRIVTIALARPAPTPALAKPSFTMPGKTPPGG
ncbi:MAG: hypothetical protein JNK84_06720 [Phreatobacter sp.]|uniref:hypothetical protein n=1 Tax=Phreatobacter sp. TaxID=1966341 RepID=UPI001A4CD438|nr:hypothetical protein [Phreatobacter sp.]MBL8568763.1 hypothetical protein [Phreatobacter sp.]